MNVGNAGVPSETPAGQKIRGAIRGIVLSNWNKKNVTVGFNDVDLNFDDVQSDNSAGIVMQGGVPNYRFQSRVMSNHIAASNYSGLNASTNTTTGISFTNGHNYEDRCNATWGAFKNMHQFNSLAITSHYFNNFMIGDRIYGKNRGLVLNTATIGTQWVWDGPNNRHDAIDDIWDDRSSHNNNYWTNGSSKTHCIQSDALKSPLHLQLNTYLYDPEPFNTRIGAYLFYGNTGTLINNPNANTISCRLYPISMFNSSGDVLTAIDEEADEEEELASAEAYNDTATLIGEDIDSVGIVELEQVAAGSAVAPGSEPDLRLYVAQMELYDLLVCDTALRESSDILRAFVADQSVSSFGIIDSILRNLADSNIATALEQLEGWEKLNRVDSNYAQYITWMIQLHYNEFVDTAAVEDMATRCPQTDGNVVFAARNLYNSLKDDHVWFVSECETVPEEEEEEGRRPSPAISGPDLKQESVKGIIVFPNPTTNTLNVTGEGLKKIDIINALGAVVITKTVVSNNTVIPIEQLVSGMYFIRIIGPDNKIIIKKIFKNIY